MLCAESCPAKAIIIEDKKPKIIYNKCISCMCCMEICPAKAVSIKRSFLAAIFTINWKF
jgi:Fe-S-cluster-containing hydrogenase component 2